jgi:Rod binding domain-containing protein
MNFSTTIIPSKTVNTRLDVDAPRSPSAEKRHKELVAQTRKWVATTFFLPMFKKMRESPWRSKIFDGGRGGEAFGAMYDQKLAEHMTRGTGSKLVNSIVRKIEAKKAYESQKFTIDMEREGADRMQAIRQESQVPMVPTRRI